VEVVCTGDRVDILLTLNLPRQDAATPGADGADAG
jgi:hypothetical protein